MAEFLVLDAIPTLEPLDLEEQRLAALEHLGLLDTPVSEGFDRITRLASFFFETPISAMSLTDRSRQWFKSYHGVKHRQIPREGAPCAEVTETNCMLHIPDLLTHKRYEGCVLAKSGIRFYAGAPLTTSQGLTLGAFCVLDTKPRNFSELQLSQLEDMAKMVMAQVELQHAYGRVDPVTGLSNRHQLTADIKDLSLPEMPEPRVLMTIEVADLRHVNEAASVLGSTYLEELLKVCSQMFRAALGKDLKLYHVGFAAFAVILDDTQDSWHEVIGVISKALTAPIELGGSMINVMVAFGVAPFVPGLTAAAEALRMATTALYEARQNDLRFAVYDEVDHATHQRRFDILKHLRHSLSHGEHFRMVYQPRIDATSGRCVGAEALLRWSHPALGTVSPSEFFPLIEQTSLTEPMTDWVIANVFAQIRTWKSQGKAVRVSINVSARNLEESDFSEKIAEAMLLHGMEANNIELEFTESAVIRHEGQVLTQLNQLRALGVDLAIDDFGTGYSSFSYLRKLPAQVVKLDQSFIKMLATDVQGLVLVSAMIRMSHDLGYRVVAEGVESQEVFSMLKALQCDEIQGYFIAAPLTVEEFEIFLQNEELERLAAAQVKWKKKLPVTLAAVA